jgi:hypothetical protein
MIKTIEIPTVLYQRLSAHAKGFETPAIVIERLLDFYEGRDIVESNIIVNKTVSLPTSLEIVYYPADEESFKRQFLQKKIAFLLLHKLDGSKEIKEWKATNFQPHSSVNGNLRSGHLRDWKKKGLVKVEISTNKSDFFTESVVKVNTSKT